MMAADILAQESSVLTDAALEARSLSNSASAIPDVGPAAGLQPFEPDQKALSAVERALRAAVGDRGWAPVARALDGVLLGPTGPSASEMKLARAHASLAAALDPSKVVPVPRWALVGQALGDVAGAINIPSIVLDDPRVEFIEGLALGCVEGIVEDVRAQVREIIKLLRVLLDYAVDFYSMSYDEILITKSLAVWFDAPGGSALDEVGRELETNYPKLWAAIKSGKPLLSSVESIVAPFRDKSAEDITAIIADWLYGLPEALGSALRPHIEAIVSAEGDPREQGAIIGRLAGPVILGLVLTALDLVNLGRHIAKFFAKQGPLLLSQTRNLAGEVLEHHRDALRKAHSGAELAFAASQTAKVAPEASTAAARVVDEVLHQLTKEWGELGHRIGPYRINSRETGAWNKAVRDYTGLSVKDVDYAVSIRLDSNHIIEDRWFDAFPDEFKRAFKDWPVLDSRGDPVLVDGKPLVVSWTSAKDMDAFALHTEAHIRSGERMATDLNLLGGEGREPLAPEMEKFFERLQTGKDGVRRPFKDLSEVLEAHKRFYQEERTGTLWPRLSGWFARATEAVNRSKLP